MITRKVYGAGLFVLLLLAGLCPSLAEGRSSGASAGARQYWLHLYHLHTGERIDILYRQGNSYLPGALAQLDHFLRDHRTNAVKAYDPAEFDLLHDLMAKLGEPNGEIDIVCGYRSPWSNEFLRAHTNGVARHSQHMLAKAIDIRVPGVSSAKVRVAALAMRRGGVGYYPVSNFVHVDVGPVRQWELAPARYRN